MEIILQPWPWYVAGPIIAAVMFFLLYAGKSFGFSGNLRTACAMAGGGQVAEFFKFDWKSQIWNLMFALGAILGGFIAVRFLSVSEEIALNPNTLDALRDMGFANPGESYLPGEIFGTDFSPKSLLILVGGGFLVGFGARYAGGCTSGHAISGLSDLQLPSLIAVVGFFIGGLVMTHLLIPIIF